MQCQVEQLEIEINNVCNLIHYVLAESVHGITACKREKSIMCCALVVNKITIFYQPAGYG